MEAVTSKVAAAFVKAQGQFGPALKNSINGHFDNKYADLHACIEAVSKALNENGIALMQPTRLCEKGVEVETVFVHESGEVLSGGVLHVPAVKSDPQGYGSALSYARRYSLMAACGIAQADDDGEAARVAKPAKPAALDREAHRSAMRKSRDLDALKVAHAEAIRAARAAGDAEAEADFNAVKEMCKAALMVSA